MRYIFVSVLIIIFKITKAERQILFLSEEKTTVKHPISQWSTGMEKWFKYKGNSIEKPSLTKFKMLSLNGKKRQQLAKNLTVSLLTVKRLSFCLFKMVVSKKITLTCGSSYSDRHHRGDDPLENSLFGRFPKN